jgi:hypothetical protein
MGNAPGKPLVAIKFGDLDDKLRLALAEELPILDNMIKQHRIAVVLVLPEWEEPTIPSLIRFLPKLRVFLDPHERDARFLTASIHDGAGSISFPRP